MIYEGLHQKYPWLLEFTILLLIVFVVSAIIERVVGVDYESINFLIGILIGGFVKLIVFLSLGTIYFKFIKKKKANKD